LYSPVFLIGQQFYSCIENNEIEVNEVNNVFAWYNPSIYFESCQEAIVEVNNNEIWNNYNQFEGTHAIYAKYSSNVSMVNNQIDGFNYGIVAFFNQNCQISNNEINDCQTIGIGILQETNSTSYITCNTIKMKNFNNSTGLLGYGMSSQSEVSGNCITDCRVSMDFRRGWGGVTLPPLPNIRNNFLYNYSSVGINVQSLSGNIGTLTDPGLNTLWSNNNASRDINSNTNITVADNFGMFNISWPQVQIVSNNPYHSTASCAHQIFNMPSQGQLNVNYTCDHFPTIAYPLTRGEGLFYLSPDYREALKASSNQYNDASIILANYDNSDVNLLNEIVELTTLSDNEKALLQYNFYYRNADYLNARMHLNQFNPNSTDEEDFKTLRLYDLDIIENGMGILLENDLEILRSIQDKKPGYSNFATSILNNSPTYTNYKIEEITVEDVEISGDVKHIENDGSFLHIYPNPFSNTVFIELINNNSETSKIELFDMTGKLVTDYTINFVAGVIELDMQKLNEGLYFITLTDPTSGFIQKGKMIKINN
jgi:parallel beta-helix repeat protein